MSSVAAAPRERHQRILTVLGVGYALAPVGPDATGGAEQILSALDRGLVAAGHHSLVVAPAVHRGGATPCRGGAAPAHRRSARPVRRRSRALPRSRFCRASAAERR